VNVGSLLAWAGRDQQPGSNIMAAGELEELISPPEALLPSADKPRSCAEITHSEGGRHSLSKSALSRATWTCCGHAPYAGNWPGADKRIGIQWSAARRQ
jgi:hypothetical protein